MISNKKLAAIIGITSYLAFPASVLAVAGAIPLKAPAGSVSNICITAIPQFIIQLLFIVGVIIAVAFLIYGGIKWIMSGGDKAGVEAARNHIVAAIVGLVIIAGAFVVIGIVFQLLGQTNPISGLVLNSLNNTPVNCVSGTGGGY